MEEGIEIGHEAITKFNGMAIGTFIRFTKYPGFLVWLTQGIVIAAKWHQSGKLCKTHQKLAGASFPETTDVYTYKGNTAHTDIQAHRYSHRNMFPSARVVTCPYCGIKLHTGCAGTCQDEWASA